MGSVDQLNGVLAALLVATLVAVVALTTAVLRLRAAARRAEDAGAEAAEHERALLSTLLGAGRDGVVVHTAAGRVVEVSPAAAMLMGAPVERLRGTAVAQLPVRWFDEHGRPLAPASVFAPRPGGPDQGAHGFVVGVEAPDRPGVRWAEVTTRHVGRTSGQGHAGELLTVLGDVTGPREIRAALARSEQQFRLAMENAPIGMALLDADWRLTEVNRALASLLGAAPAVLAGRDLSALSHPEDRRAERSAVQNLLGGGGGDRLSLEKRYLRTDGQIVWVVLDAVLVRDGDGRPDHFVAQVRDVTESRMQSEMLAHRAMHDALTGLANRSLMQEVLQSALESPAPEGRVAVIVVDLDEFKQINDRYGHAAGDDVLVHVAGVLRAATAGRGTPARLGGDEFVVVVEDPDAARVVFEVAAGIHHGLRNPVRTQQRRLPVRASVGIAVVDRDLAAGGAMALLAAADAALYRAKAGGRGRSEVYEPSMEMSQSSTHGAAAELGRGIDAGELVLHYQPTVDLGTGHVVGHEALVRWQHPDRGLLLPGAFLSTAEETGLGVALGLSVVAQAVLHLARTEGAGGWVSVNVSADQLSGGELTERILSELARHRIAPGRLVVELTESSIVEEGTRIRQELLALRSAGVPVLLDDFGTGAVPLSYLRDLPVNGVKLDMSFTAGIPDDPAAERVSRAIGALAREMDLVTIAEGIETSDQADHLASAGWAYGQGWLFGAGQSEPVRSVPGAGSARTSEAP